jgi:hypothetical protein
MVHGAILYITRESLHITSSLRENLIVLIQIKNKRRLSNISKYIMHFVFYTTAEQEQALDAKYQSAIDRMQADIDRFATAKGKHVKFTAYAHVVKPERVFWIHKSNVYYNTVSSENLSIGPYQKGGVYKLDRKFEEQIEAFAQKHGTFKVVFKPSGRYGPTIEYYNEDGFVPAVLMADDGDLLVVEDDARYEIMAC